MTLVKAIDSTTWAALTSITASEGTDLSTVLGDGTYRLIRADAPTCYTEVEVAATSQIKAITEAQWAGLTEINVSPGTDMTALLSADTYRLIRSDATTAVVASGALSIDSLSYLRGGPGVSPDLKVTPSSTGTTTGNYTLYWASRSTGTPMGKDDIENGTGDALDTGTVVNASLASLSDTLNLTTALTGGSFDAFLRDSSTVPIESGVVSTSAVTYDAVAPAYSSSVVENAAPSNLVITLTKAAYEAGTLANTDFTLGGTYAGSISTATLTGPTTIILGLSTPVANGDTLTVALTDGAVLVGVDAEAVATWTAESVTNNVAAAGITATDIFNGEAGFSATPTYNTLPVLAAGTYIIFAHIDQSGITFTGGTLEGTSLGTALGSATEDPHHITAYAVTIAGGGNQTLVLNLSTGTASAVARVVKISSGSVTETEVANAVGNPADLDFTFANSADGLILCGWSSTTALGSYDSMTALSTPVAHSELSEAVGQASVSGGTPVTVGFNSAAAFTRSVGVAVKVV